jgi:hypothetical protein
VAVFPSAETNRDSQATNSSCKARSAAIDTCGAPTLMVAQYTGSSFHAATFVTTPGASSMCAISPDARRSSRIRRTWWR